MSTLKRHINGTQPPPTRQRRGLLLNGRYQLQQEVGHGGMGTVYLAQDTYLQREVAVKMLDGHILGSDGRSMLLHEARAAARLSHPNVVMVFDLGESDEVPFVVMEYVPGQTLAEARPTRIQEVIRIGRQLCAALHHAHQKGLVHRDVKPANVLMTPEGVAKLTDFGLARALDRPLDPNDSFSGTLSYVAPEQAMGQPVTYAADLYAFGVLLYELTTGERPFTGNPTQLLVQHLQEKPQPPRDRNPNIPSALNELILNLLQKEPSERPSSANEVTRLLSVMSKLHRLANLIEI